MTLCAADVNAKANSAVEIDIVKQPAEASHKLKIESQTASDDGRAGKVVFNAPGGIFLVDIDLAKTKLKTLTFVVKNVKGWEGVGFMSKPEKAEEPPVEIDMHSDVRVRGQDGDCIIELGEKAVDALRKGGRFQFIDFYRR